jgi:CHAT domain-containing protein
MSEILHWSAGSAAQLDLFAPQGDKNTFLVNYRSPFRCMIRQDHPCPAAGSTLGRADLRLNEALDAVRQQNRVTRAAKYIVDNTPESDNLSPGSVAEHLRRVGDELYDFVPLGMVRTELRQPKFFLEIGTSDDLVGYPWELIHDRDEFLCLKHCMARYVNTTPTFPRDPALSLDVSFSKIRVLVISVPHPRDTKELYPTLSAAQAETKELMDLMAQLPNVEMGLLANENANLHNVREAIRDKYQIIHFCGHANFDSKDASNSNIVLNNGELPAKNLVGLVNPSVVLSFINACQTAASSAPETPPRNEWEAQFNMFGLARAFIEAGSYYLGSRWQLSDDAARVFSRTFYTALLRDRKSLGEAVLQARAECKTKAPNDIAWASYVYYGDPRIGFQHVS